MKLIAKEDFRWAHRGVDVQDYQAGEEIDTEDEDLIEVSIREGWAAAADGEAPAPSRRPRTKQ